MYINNKIYKSTIQDIYHIHITQDYEDYEALQ